jgi:hypothetical protein
MRSEALECVIIQGALSVKVSRCSCEVVKRCSGRLKTVGVMWMMTYLESSRDIPYMQVRAWLPMMGWREAGMGSSGQPLCFGEEVIKILYTAGRI